MRLLSSISVALIFLAPSSAAGAGIAAIKEQPFHADASAKAVVYVDFLDDGGPSIRINTGSKVFTIERTKLAGKVEVLPSLPVDITNDYEVSILRKADKEYREFSLRFPKSVTLLEDQMKALDGYIKDFDGGKVRYQGEWMDKEKMVELKHQQEEQLTRELAERKRKGKPGRHSKHPKEPRALKSIMAGGCRRRRSRSW